MFTPSSSIGKVELMMDLISQRQVAKTGCVRFKSGKHAYTRLCKTGY